MNVMRNFAQHVFSGALRVRGVRFVIVAGEAIHCLSKSNVEKFGHAESVGNSIVFFLIVETVPQHTYCTSPGDVLA